MFDILRNLMPNTGEPFGLPNGTVRGIIALSFTFTTLYLYVTSGTVDTSLLGISTLIIGNYFGTRGNVPSTEQPAPAPVDAPYIPGEQGNG